ncbi:MAG: hypothetical protein L0312_14425 [Acidobacteria bacterium]|nr:hypothetical protein [Acidobacteriota bacterium]
MDQLSAEQTNEQLWACIYKVRRIDVLLKTCQELEYHNADERGELVPRLIEIATEILARSHPCSAEHHRA